MHRHGQRACAPWLAHHGGAHAVQPQRASLRRDLSKLSASRSPPLPQQLATMHLQLGWLTHGSRQGRGAAWFSPQPAPMMVAPPPRWLPSCHTARHGTTARCPAVLLMACSHTQPPTCTQFMALCHGRWPTPSRPMHAALAARVQPMPACHYQAAGALACKAATVVPHHPCRGMRCAPRALAACPAPAPMNTTPAAASWSRRAMTHGGCWVHQVPHHNGQQQPWRACQRARLHSCARWPVRMRRPPAQGAPATHMYWCTTT